MKILVINAGSSSLKYQLIDMANKKVLAKGNCERIGIGGGKLSYKNFAGQSYEYNIDMPNHTVAFNNVKNALISGDEAVINSLSEITAIGHRVVQGGALFKHSVLVDEEVINGIESLNDLAPLHNPAHIQGIRAAVEAFGREVPQVAVFDTAFHSTMPPKAYIFGIPYEYYEKYQIRRYGFHGTSHRYVTGKCLELLGREEAPEGTKIITCHLGNGSSIAAVKDGLVVDTTMGLTPLDGFIMGTRSGAIDPSVVTFLAEKENLSPKEMSDLLNKQSGFLGLSGISSDDRDVTAAAKEGNERAILTQDILRYQIIKYIGSYIAAMGGVDAIVFTAGIGENQTSHREEICEGLSFFGVELDKEVNASKRGELAEISTASSKVRVYVIPTDEEIVIAEDTAALVKSLIE
ncbi:MAG: acetate kinase [Oscillospiraceae bacterium]|nr:acetate kinase [Oscillospiraceae bacterium]